MPATPRPLRSVSDPPGEHRTIACAPSRGGRILVALLLLVGGIVAAPSVAQDDPAATAPPREVADDPPITDSIATELAALEARTDLTDEDRQTIATALTRARERVDRTSQLRSSATEFAESGRTAPDRLAEIRAELATPAVEPTITIPEGADLAALRAALEEAEKIRAALADEVERLGSEDERRRGRREELTPRIGTLEEERAKLDADLATPLENATALARATRLADRARRAEIEAELASIRAEISSYEARRDLIPARRDLRRRELGSASKTVELWENAVGARQKADAAAAQRDAARARAEAARQDEVLRDFAAETEKLLKTNVVDGVGPADRVNELTAQVRAARTELRQMRGDFRSLKRRLELSGSTTGVGAILSRLDESLPRVNVLSDQFARTRDRAERAQITILDLEELRSQAGDIDGVARELLDRITTAGRTVTPEMETVARELAAQRRDAIDRVRRDVSAELEQLVEAETVLRSQLAATKAFREFIDERILWVPSVDENATWSVSHARETLGRLLSPVQLGEGVRRSVSHFTADWPRWSLGLLGLVALLAVRVRVRALLDPLAERVRRFSTDKYRYTVAALAISLLASLAIPYALGFLGLLLRAPVGQNEAARAVGIGLIVAAFGVLEATILLSMARRNGVFEAHFRWARPTLVSLSRRFRIYVLIIAPIYVLTFGTRALDPDAARDSLSRLMTVVLMFALLWITFAVLRPRGPVMANYFAQNPRTLITRTRWAWFTITILVPVALALASLGGYRAAALVLSRQYYLTLLLVVFLLIANGMAMRWLFIMRRSLAVEDARRRRDAAKSGEDAMQTELEIDERVDLPAISESVRRLFQVGVIVVAILGVALIWRDVVPAFRVLDRISIYPQIRMLEVSDAAIPPELRASESVADAPPDGSGGDGAGPDASGGVRTTESTAVTPMLPGMPALPNASGGGGTGDSTVVSAPTAAELDESAITLSEVLRSVAIVLAAWVGVRYLPGLAELLLLQRLSLDGGTRYAVNTVLRYVIIGIGAFLAFGALGLQWSSIQWLAAALTFGLAFGLQEIFANFISGLILLGERPIRVGDIVTISGTSGRVTRIRMRATTIIDWDRKELVVPNKTLITSDVVNWTLSDATQRVTVPVGIGYGEDIDLARELLLEIAAADPNVLSEPPPQVWFLGFGDSTLNFDLRVFSPSPDPLLTIRDALCTAILKRFREAGIEIAFPQRDLHLRSVDSGVSRLLAPGTKTPPDIVDAESARESADDATRTPPASTPE